MKMSPSTEAATLKLAVVLLFVQHVGPVALGPTPAVHAAEEHATVRDLRPPSNARRIPNSETAIRETLELLPAEFDYHSIVARQVSREALQAGWYISPDTESASWLPEGPLWIVGALAEGLTVDDVILLPDGARIGVDDASAVAGAFALWEASSGDLLESGALEDEQSFSHPRLLALVDESEERLSGITLAHEKPMWPSPSRARLYRVRPGDSLWRIASALLGDASRWPELYDANKDVIGGNPSLILPGTQLSVP